MATKKMNQISIVAFFLFSFIGCTPIFCRAADYPSKTDQLNIEFRLAEDTEFPGSVAALLPSGEGETFLHPKPHSNDQVVAKAAVISNDQGKPAISIEFSEQGSKWMEELSSKHVGKRLAVLLDKEILQARRIVGAIGRRAIIQGDFSIQKAVAQHAAMKDSATSPVSASSLAPQDTMAIRTPAFGQWPSRALTPGQISVHEARSLRLAAGACCQP